MKQMGAYKMFKKLHEKIFISIQFNKAYFLYVLECENASYWYVSKTIKGHASNLKEVKKREKISVWEKHPLFIDKDCNRGNLLYIVD